MIFLPFPLISFHYSLPILQHLTLFPHLFSLFLPPTKVNVMDEKKRPVILITNDDGAFSMGIKTLMNVASKFGDVVVFAPDKVQSGTSNAISTKTPILSSKLYSQDGVTVYSSSGTPTDCVKLAFYSLFRDVKPDLLLSGINHGSNTSVNTIYSGTMGAALEGCINHVPSIAFSLCDYSWNADFSHTIPFIEKIIDFVLRDSLSFGTCLNVNFPKGEVKGIKVCRQANAYWDEEFDPRKGKYGFNEYWLVGKFVNREPLSRDTDMWAIDNGYASMVPIKIDMSDMDSIKYLKTKIE
jgi:5'-nucleotidase